MTSAVGADERRCRAARTAPRTRGARRRSPSRPRRRRPASSIERALEPLVVEVGAARSSPSVAGPRQCALVGLAHEQRVALGLGVERDDADRVVALLVELADGVDGAHRRLAAVDDGEAVEWAPGCAARRGSFPDPARASRRVPPGSPRSVPFIPADRRVRGLPPALRGMMRRVALTPIELSLHGHQISYRTGGSGPALLLLHGITNSSETWEHVAPPLAERFTVIAPDLLGHGAVGDAARRLLARRPRQRRARRAHRARASSGRPWSGIRSAAGSRCSSPTSSPSAASGWCSYPAADSAGRSTSCCAPRRCRAPTTCCRR